MSLYKTNFTWADKPQWLRLYREIEPRTCKSLINCLLQSGGNILIKSCAFSTVADERANCFQSTVKWPALEIVNVIKSQSYLVLSYVLII